MVLKVGGLFSGVGGIELGFEKAGYEIAWANEIDKDACITYRKNFSHLLYEEDIHQLIYPSEVEIEKIGVRGIYLSNYVLWDPLKQHIYMSKKYGYKFYK